MIKRENVQSILILMHCAASDILRVFLVLYSIILTVFISAVLPDFLTDSGIQAAAQNALKSDFGHFTFGFGVVLGLATMAGGMSLLIYVMIVILAIIDDISRRKPKPTRETPTEVSTDNP
jgi:hypothetical protein